ncbi:hypothetical protein OS493_010038, partial [Desmophyllum pertusum]
MASHVDLATVSEFTRSVETRVVVVLMDGFMINTGKGQACMEHGRISGHGQYKAKEK